MTDPSPAELRRNRQRANADMTLREQVEAEVEQVVVAARNYTFKPEPKCRVCQDDRIVAEVNQRLARGASYASILRGIEGLLEDVPVPDRPSYASIRNHAKRHFAADEAGRASYREILERRAIEADIDFIEGVATAVTPMAFMETMMNRGYESMVLASEGAVSPELGLKAAMKMQEYTRADASTNQIEHLRAQLNQVIEAVRSEVPVEYWDAIVRRMDQISPPGDFIDAEGTEEIDQ